jgi:hypothetical protein
MDGKELVERLTVLMRRIRDDADPMTYWERQTYIWLLNDAIAYITAQSQAPAAPMTEAACEHADSKDFQYAGLHGVEARRRFIQDHEPKTAEAPTLVEEVHQWFLSRWAEGFTSYSLATLGDMQELVALVAPSIRRLSQPATTHGESNG